VDPIDWVERIPFSETRNYVQRVMENLNVYRVRFEGAAVASRPVSRPATSHEANSAVLLAEPATAP
jgi:soluble lytic murein transglycosylase